MPTRNMNSDYHIYVSLLTSLRDAESSAIYMLNSNDSFIDKDCKRVLAPYFLEVPGYMSSPTSCWGFFIESKAKNYSSPRGEAGFQKGGDAGDHSDDVILAVVSASAVDVLAVKVAGEGGILPLRPSIGSNWNNLRINWLRFCIIQRDTPTS